MFHNSLFRQVLRGLVLAVLLSAGLASAQSEPTLNQVYAAAKAGKIEQAQSMMQQVLVAHPNSAKAHFVQAEIAVRQGQWERAREALATAEKLAPGLPFAKPEAVQNLRAQLADRPSAIRSAGQLAPQADLGARSAPSAGASSFPWGVVLTLGAAAVAFMFFLSRRRAQSVEMAGNVGPGPLASSALQGPQSFGMNANMPPYAAPGSGGGLGSKVMGGLATGLAVGAGVMAAQAIGKTLMGSEEHLGRDGERLSDQRYEPMPDTSSDLGGENFGVNDASSWDDGGGFSGGADGGGWDS